MRNILIGFLVIGICGIAYSSPIPDNSTPSYQTVSSSTEKIVNEAHTTLAAKKGEKEIAPTTPSATTKLPDHSDKGLGATVTTAKKNEATTSQSHKEEPTTIPPSSKPEIKDPTPSNKQEVKETTSSGHRVEPTNPVATGQKEPTTIKPVDGNKGKTPNNNQKPTKSSTAYLDKGKVVIFNGICGPDGCEIEGDIYDELVPLSHTKKQG